MPNVLLHNNIHTLLLFSLLSEVITKITTLDYIYTYHDILSHIHSLHSYKPHVHCSDQGKTDQCTHHLTQRLEQEDHQPATNETGRCCNEGRKGFQGSCHTCIKFCL